MGEAVDELKLDRAFVLVVRTVAFRPLRGIWTHL